MAATRASISSARPGPAGAGARSASTAAPIDGFAAIRERFAAAQTSTYVAAQDDARPLQSWTGTRLADEFDLEGTAGHVPEFSDLLVREALAWSR